MAPYVLMVLTNPVEGREDEYNTWYDTAHLPDVLSVKGFVAAQRFEVSEVSAASVAHRSVTIYEIECDDIGATAQALLDAQLPVSDAFDRGSASAIYYRPVTDRIVAT